MDNGLLLAALPYMPWVFAVFVVLRAIYIVRLQLKGLR